VKENTMPKRMTLEITVAAGCALMLVAAGCSERERDAKIKPVAELELPSIAKDKPALTSVDVRIPAPEMPRGEVEEPRNVEPEESPSVDMPAKFGALVRFAKTHGGSDRKLAMSALAKARKLKPGSARPDIEAARIELAAGNPDAARPFVESAVEIDSESSYAWNTMGRVELGEGDLEAALSSFERAADADEDNSFAWNNLGLVLMRLDRYPEAASALEQATGGLKPTPYMWNNLGMAYEHLNRFDLAGAAYRRAEELGSGKATANLKRLEEGGIDLSPPVDSPEEIAASEAMHSEGAVE